jgi:hypothetical protein
MHININVLLFRVINFCIILIFLSKVSIAQTYLERYGQNRIQYRKFSWKVFETDHFRVFHYDRSGKELARYVAEQSEKDMASIQSRVKKSNVDKFNIVLYNSVDDYRQSNIGRSNDASQVRSTESGTVDFFDDKLVVYFTGVHTDLRNQIQDGISKVFLEKDLKGGSLDQIAFNSAKNNIPDWLQKGYTQYSAAGWTEQTDKAWKGIMEGNPKKKFYNLTQINGPIAGQAFWKYVSERYGKNEPKSLMGLMKSKGNMNKSLREKYKLNVVDFFDSCLFFYKTAFAKDAENKELRNIQNAVVKIKVPSDNTNIRNIRVSPRGADVAFVKWKEGIFKVCLKHTIGEQQEAVILEGGEKNFNEIDDPNYPLLAWSNTGYKLAILYKKGAGMRLRIYDATKGKMFTYVVPNNRFDRALGMAIDEDNNGIILSAIRKSQTDLYYFSIKGAKMRNLTNDSWDDVQPAFVTGGQKRGIMFLSNRPKPNMNVASSLNELPTGPMNVYFYNTTTKSSNLFQCSNIDSNILITQPIQYGPDNFAYITDSKGVRNKYVVVFGRNQKNQDSAYWVPVTNLSHSLNSHQYNPAGDLVADVIQQDGFYNVYFSKLNVPAKGSSGIAVEKAILVEDEKDKIGIDNIIKNARKPKDGSKIKQDTNIGIPNLENGSIFQSEFASNNNVSRVDANQTIDQIESLSTSETEESSFGPDSSFIKMKAQPYRVAFKPNSFSFSLDNNLLFTRYQAAGQNGNQFANPSLGGLITFSMDDLMEDYRFSGGFRLPFGNNGSTYFAQFENVKRRLDWSLAFMRNANTQQYTLQFIDSASGARFNTLGIGKTTTTLVQGSFSYPFDKLRSLRLQIGLRQDALVFKAIDTFSIIVPNDRNYWTMSRLEYVYDNTKHITTNILNGSRYKIFGEYMSQMNNNGGSVYNIGFDFRSYQKIHKNLIWAFRAAAAHSGGKQKILYFLGGVDNWLNYQQASPAAPVNQETYGFQTLGNTLRGYKQNARNGNSYAVANSEFRFPILTSLIQRPIQSKILRSLQMLAFTDIGLAWNGLIPNDATMSKSQLLTQAPVSLLVNMPNTQGVAIGYGLGMRMAVSGYQFRVDAAWNKEGIKTPIIYLSLGTDF